MQESTQRKLQVIVDTHQYQLSRAEEQRFHDILDALARQVEHFPLADLRVLIEGNQRSNDISVKLSLILPGATLVTTDHDITVQTAFERALDSLVNRLEAYKDKLGNVSERQKMEMGTHQELHATVPIDADALEQAVAAGDFTAFRTATFDLEEGLRKRIGRWIQRYPEFEARIGKGIEIADIVEGVFLRAFEDYAHRPLDVPFGTWLESLIDPAVKALQDGSGEELENIQLLRSARSAEQGPQSV